MNAEKVAFRRKWLSSMPVRLAILQPRALVGTADQADCRTLSSVFRCWRHFGSIIRQTLALARSVRNRYLTKPVCVAAHSIPPHLEEFQICTAQVLRRVRRKIIRLRWRLWTSRKFCERCVPRLAKQQWLHAGVVSFAILLAGVALGRAGRSTPPPLVIQRSVDGRITSATGQQNAANPAATLVEEIYTCGARTKKGAPCSRRVHGPVRCWQHKGMPAMLPQEKLRIKE